MGRITGKNGAVAFITSVVADFNGWRLSFSQPIDDTTSYTDTGTGAAKGFAGTVDYTFSATGFLKANVASTAPGWGGATASIATSSSITLTAHTACTLAGTAMLSGGSISHGKRQGSVPVSYDGAFSGDLTETWAVS